jgi:hypothetical protein
MAKLKFKETQRYKHWEVIALLAILTLGTAIRLVVTTVSGEAGDNGNLFLGIFLLASLLLTLGYFLKVKMKVKVDTKGVKYSIYPWQKSKQKIKWEEVENFEIIELPEQAALSGWSVQYGSRTRGWNMGKNRGLQLNLRNGERYFLSIENLDDLENILEEIFEEK